MEPLPGNRADRAIARYMHQPLNLMTLTLNKLKTVEWLMQVGFFKAPNCPKRCRIMSLHNKGPECSDGVVFICGNCKDEVSIRKSTIFFQRKLSIVEMTRMTFVHFLERHTIRRIIQETGGSKPSIISLFKSIRNCISFYVRHLYSLSQLGRNMAREINPNGNFLLTPAVEADESMFMHLPLEEREEGEEEGEEGEEEFQEEVHRIQVWCVGVIDRATKEIVVKVVQDRTQETLIGFLRHYVATNTTNANSRTRIYTDGWPSYNGLENFGYSHHSIPHVEGFGEGTETTNQIESLWGELKELGGFNKGVQATTFESANIC